MSVAQFRGVALYKRSSWRKELDESKIDMGLMDPFAQETLDQGLYAAVVEEDCAAIREMAAMGADKNMRLAGEAGEPSCMLLHAAVALGSLKVVIALLQLGCDPLLKDGNGATPRDLAEQSANSRLRTVLKLWEQRKTEGQDEGQFEALLRTGS